MICYEVCHITRREGGGVLNLMNFIISFFVKVKYISCKFSSQEIDVEIELTANHFGRFEMFLCPNNNPAREATQECFDQYPLVLSGSREHRFYIPGDTKKKGVFK